MLKIKNPEEIEPIFKEMGDKLGMGIDENIFRSIVILNSLGYKTRQSCEGHEDRYSTYPWIDLIWDEKKDDPDYYNESLEEFHKNIFQDLKEFYKNRKVPYDQIISFRKYDKGELLVRLCQNQNSKCFENRPEKLKLYVNEINEFCEFLNHKYNLNY